MSQLYFKGKSTEIIFCITLSLIILFNKQFCNEYLNDFRFVSVEETSKLLSFPSTPDVFLNSLNFLRNSLTNLSLPLSPSQSQLYNQQRLL